MSRIQFQHKQFYSVSEQLEAMRWVKENIRKEDFDGRAFPMAQPYAPWEIDETIGWELQRNLIVAIICVFFTTFILIADLGACLLVLVIVVINLVSCCMAFKNGTYINSCTT